MKKFIELKRNRVVYKKRNIKFEIDKYISPDKFFVLAVEGNKKEIETVWEELKKLNKELEIK